MGRNAESHQDHRGKHSKGLTHGSSDVENLAHGYNLPDR
jgi:hypothetical protein